MGYMKDLYITIYNGGDEAVAAVQEYLADRGQMADRVSEVFAKQSVTQDEIGAIRRAERFDEICKDKAERQRLRDQFAAAALAGMLDKSDAGTELAAWWPEMVCAAAYRWADAMLEARR